jgi:hypothetical protein
MSIYGKGAKGKCDKLFSKIIRSRGACERCGNTDYSTFQCAHIISRKYAATRTNQENAWNLCAKCHRRLTDWPREHSHFITQTIGSERYEALRRTAETPTKVNWDAEYERLKAIAQSLDI